MPATPSRPCRRCKRVLTTETYCPDCKAIVTKKRQKQDTRLPASKRGYDWQWSKVRKMKLSINPLCEMCLKEGRATAADTVHHIVEVEQDPSLRLDLKNLMSLCRDCHEKIHGRVKTGHGVDGMPVGGRDGWCSNKQ